MQNEKGLCSPATTCRELETGRSDTTSPASVMPVLLTQAPVESSKRESCLWSSPSSNHDNASIQQNQFSRQKPTNLKSESDEQEHCYPDESVDEDGSEGSMDHLGTQSPPASAEKAQVTVESMNINGSARDGDEPPEHTNDSSYDDGSDDSSSSSEDELLIERRRKRVAQNEIKLEQLGLQRIKPRRKKQFTKRKPDEVVKEDLGIGVGCVFQVGTESSGAHSEDLCKKYPGREPQIRLLKGILHGVTSQLDQEEEYIAPPIFISGPGGAGKTSIARDVVQSLVSPRIASAYINCAILEPSSIEALVESAYRQISRTFEKQKGDKRNRRRKKTPNGSSRISLSLESQYVDAIGADIEDQVELARALLKQQEHEQGSDAFTSEGNGQGPVQQPSTLTFQSTGGEYSDQTEMLDRVDGNTSLKVLREDDKNPDGGYVEIRTRYSKKSKACDFVARPMVKLGNAYAKDIAGSAPTSHGAPLAFGRSLAPFLGENGTGYAFLILDRAERLMDLSPNEVNSRAKSNYLTQLLLLPKVMELKMAIIVISRNSLLMSSRK